MEATVLPGDESRGWPSVRPASSTYELLQAALSRTPDRIALTMLPTGNPDDGDVRISRRELLERINRAANLFAALGIGPGDSVATLLPSGIEALVVTLGAQAAGIAAPVNPMLAIDEIEHLVQLAGSRILVASSDPELGIWSKAEELARRLPGLKLFSVGTQQADVEDFGEAAAAHSGDELAFIRVITPNDIASYIHTGGTTGLPKLASITHDNFIYGAWAQSRLWRFGEADVILSALPLFHVSGLATLAMVPLSVGAEVVFLSPSGFRNPQIVRNFWRIVEQYRGSFSAFVPTIAHMLTQVPSAGIDLSSLRTVMIGGAAAPADTIVRLKQHVPARIVTTYGQTECLTGTGSSLDESLNPLSSGRTTPFMHVAVRPRDGQGGDLPPGEPGRILLKGPAVFAGYKDQPRGDSWTDDGWLVSGDVGWLDESGSLFVTGRTKDLIIRSGHNIDPRAIEEAAASHPAVASCAAVGAPDRYAGELPVLYVSLRDGKTVDEAELLDWVAARVPERPAAPKHVHILPSLPVTVVGKLYKPPLRLDAAERVARRELAGPIGEGAIATIAARHDDRFGIVIDVTPGAGQPAEILRRAKELLSGFLFTVQIDAAGV
jgi:fatty-acyl-CoA synthase